MRRRRPSLLKKTEISKYFEQPRNRIIFGLGLLALAFLVYQIPWVNERLAWRLDNYRTRITYFFNPPDEAIFLPTVAVDFQATASAVAQARTATPTISAQITPSATLPPVAPRVVLEGINYVDQHQRWNYCGPANLTMALNFWGWDGNRDDIARVVKPGIDRVDGKEDKNVMPYELENYVENEAGMEAVVRVGGELDTIKRLVEAGFPVIVEKGYYERDYTGKLGWLGHYQLVNGYDEAGGFFIVQDTFLETGENGTGANMEWDYQDFLDNWRSFNYLFMVVYPDEQFDTLVETLGSWADEEWANRHALEIADLEAQSLIGIDQFFAYFNQGSSHVRLFEYVDAAFAYDFAFQLYAQLDDDETSRPYRIMWYQTGPYFAYYYSGRYQDTINLANTTLFETIDEPTLEESFYWRGLALEALGEIDNAIADYQETVRLNINFEPGWTQLERLGVGN